MKKSLFSNRKPPISTYGPEDYLRTGALERLRILDQGYEADAVLANLQHPPDVGVGTDPADLWEMWEEYEANL